MITIDNKDKLNERKKLKLVKFNTTSRGLFIPKTFLDFLGAKDGEDLYLASYQVVDGENKNGKRYFTCERCEEL